MSKYYNTERKDDMEAHHWKVLSGAWSGKIFEDRLGRVNTGETLRHKIKIFPDKVNKYKCPGKVCK